MSAARLALGLVLCTLLSGGCTAGARSASSQGGTGGVAGTNPGASGESGMNNAPAGAGGAPAGAGGVGETGGTPAVGGHAPNDDAALTPLEPDAGNPAPSKTFVYVSGYDPQISVLELDVVAATVTARSVTDAAVGAQPTFLAFSPNKRFAYAIDEQLNGPAARVIAFAIDQATGALTEINRQDTGATIGAHVAVHPSGQWVLSANYGGGSVSAFAVRNDGGLEPASVPVAAGGQAHQITFDAAGSVAFVPCVMAQHLAVFDFADGTLTPHDPATIALAGGPRTLAFTPDQRFVYVLTQDESTISAFAFEPVTAGLTFIETVPATPSGGSFSAHLVVHESGKFLYASNRMDNGIALFNVNPDTGRLTEVEQHREMLDFPRLFAIDPSGELMLIGNQHSNSLVTRRIDPETGQLQVVGSPLTVPPEPTFVGILSIP